MDSLTELTEVEPSDGSFSGFSGSSSFSKIKGAGAAAGWLEACVSDDLQRQLPDVP